MHVDKLRIFNISCCVVKPKTIFHIRDNLDKINFYLIVHMQVNVCCIWHVAYFTTTNTTTITTTTITIALSRPSTA